MKELSFKKFWGFPLACNKNFLGGEKI